MFARNVSPLCQPMPTFRWSPSRSPGMQVCGLLCRLDLLFLWRRSPFRTVAVRSKSFSFRILFRGWRPRKDASELRSSWRRRNSFAAR